MKTYVEFIAESVDQGLYTFRRPALSSMEYLAEWMLENHIPNAVPARELHVTVVCSEKEVSQYAPDPTLVMLNPATYRIEMLAEALVLKFASDPLLEQWQRAMNMGAKSRYPTFIPHITLSYKVPVWFDLHELKPPSTFIVLDAEQCRGFVDGWASINGLSEEIETEQGIYVPQHSLNIPRQEMPQIADANKLEFIDWLENQGILVQFLELPVSLLRSVQDEIDLKKVEHLATNLPEKAINKPIIVSKDNYIMDGHHRWLAILNRDPHYALPAYRVDLPIQELLTLTRQYKTSH